MRLRGSIDYPLASAAAFVAVANDKKVTACRVVIGAAGAAPKLIDGVSHKADMEGIAQKAYEHAEGVDNLKLPGAYRKKMMSVLAKRAIQAAIDDVQRK